MKSPQDMSWLRLVHSNSGQTTQSDSFPIKFPIKSTSFTSVQTENIMALTASQLSRRISSDSSSPYDDARTSFDGTSFDYPFSNLGALVPPPDGKALEAALKPSDWGLQNALSNVGDDRDVGLSFSTSPVINAEILVQILEDLPMLLEPTSSRSERDSEDSSLLSGDETHEFPSIAEASFGRVGQAQIVQHLPLPRIEVFSPSTTSVISYDFNNAMSRAFENSEESSLGSNVSVKSIHWSDDSAPSFVASETWAFDGPAIEPSNSGAKIAAQKAFQKERLDDTQSVSSQRSNMHDLEHCETETPVLNTAVPMGIVQTVPVTNVIPQKRILSATKRGLASRQTPNAPIPANSGVTAIPPPPVMPGLPFDQTGTLPSPPTPKSNTSKRQKAKIRSQRLVRNSRRGLLKKPVLKILLGRQLAGPTYESLTILSKNSGLAGATTVLDTTSTTLPVSAPIPI